MKPITHSEAVRHVEANARLAGVQLDDETLRALSELSAEVLESWLQTQLALAVLDNVPPTEPEEWDKLPD